MPLENAQPSEPDFTAPAIQLAALTALGAVSAELERAADAACPDDDAAAPDPAAFRAALARAAVLLAELSRWAGAAP